MIRQRIEQLEGKLGRLYARQADQQRHEHAAISGRERGPWGFTGPVAAEDENRAAHGNVGWTDVCSCGAERDMLVNGVHEELGPWHPSADLEAEIDQVARELAVARNERDTLSERAKRVRSRRPAARRGKETIRVDEVSDRGATIVCETWREDGSLDGRRCGRTLVRWGELERAAAQDDETLRLVYGELWRDAVALRSGGAS